MLLIVLEHVVQAVQVLAWERTDWRVINVTCDHDSIDRCCREMMALSQSACSSCTSVCQAFWDRCASAVGVCVSHSVRRANGTPALQPCIDWCMKGGNSARKKLANNTNGTQRTGKSRLGVTCHAWR